MIQKQSLKVFYKNRCIKKFRKIDKNIPVPESFFNKVAGKACNFIKKETLTQVFSCEFCEIKTATLQKKRL